MTDDQERKPTCFGYYEEDADPDNECNHCNWVDACFGAGAV